VNKKLARISSLIFIMASVLAFGVMYYVGHHLPHGPSIPTGDYVCMNDGRGPCGEERVEDMSQLAIPEWAKFVRRYGLLAVILLPLAAWLFHSLATNEVED
jgi:hypothetical protein